MVCASICGSSASAAYGRGGTSNAMKCSPLIVGLAPDSTRVGFAITECSVHDPPLPTAAPDRARTAGRRRGDLAQAHGSRRARAPDRHGPVVVAAGGLAGG